MKTVELLGTGLTVGIQLLSKNKIREAVFATEDVFKQDKRGVQDGINQSQVYIEYQRELRCQLLFLACIDPDDKQPYFKSSKQIGDDLLPPQIDDLYEKYGAFQDEVCPVIEDMGDEAFLKLKKKLLANSAVEVGKISNLPIAKRLLLSFLNDAPTSSIPSG